MSRPDMSRSDMPHPDDADLALLALGESVSADADRHIDECSRCRSRVDQLSAVVATARTITDDDRPVAPPASVWEGIVAQTSSGQSSGDVVVSLDRERRRRRPALWWLAAAAAVGVVVGSVVTTATTDFGTPMPDIVASAELEPVEDSAYRGTAWVETRGSDAVLRVSVPDLPAVDDGYYEVWMASSDAATMVAIGTLNPGEEAVLPLPAGMQMADFPLVDVSVEHFDGDAGHSAVSVVRGLLPA